MFELIILGRSIMSRLLAQPAAPGRFGNRTGYSLGINYYRRVMFGCCFIDEQIIISTRNMIDRGESFTAEE